MDDQLREARTQELMAGYVDVCNRAIRKVADTTWYRKAKELNGIFWSEPRFRTLVYDQNPSHIVGQHTIHFDPETDTLSHRSEHLGDEAFTWKVSVRYLEDVAVKRPEWYAENPLMLDWKWLKDRVRSELADRYSLVTAGAAGFALGTAIGALSARYLR